MRTMTTLGFDAEVLSQLKDLAKALGVPLSALVELGTKYVLTVSHEKMSAWAADLPDRRGRPKGSKNRPRTADGKIERELRERAGETADGKIERLMHAGGRTR